MHVCKPTCVCVCLVLECGKRCTLGVGVWVKLHFFVNNKQI